MFVLRYLYILALGVWLGGMGVAGLIAAPAIFEVLEGWNAVDGRVLAGQVFGRILFKLHLVLYAAAAVMLVTLTIRRLLGPRPVAYGIRASIIATMLALAVASGFGISPRVEAMQKEIAVAEQEVRAHEDKLLEHMERAETFAAELKAADSALKAEQAEVAREQKLLDAERAALE